MKRKTSGKTAVLLSAAAAVTACASIAAYSADTRVNSSFIAEAAADTVSFDPSDGTLTLRGRVDRDEFAKEVTPPDVKAVKAEAGTVLPEYSAGLFTMMSSCTSFDLKNADTAGVHNMSGMFNGCSAVKALDLSGWDTGNVTEMASMFSNCTSLESVDLSSFDTSNVVHMTAMFMSCPELKAIDVSGFDTRKTESFADMFCGCRKLRRIDTSGFRTYRAKNVQAMFSDCEKLVSLDLSGFDIAELPAESKLALFSGANDLRSLKLGSSFGDMTEDMGLVNSENGWADTSTPGTRISGSKAYAVIPGSGKLSSYQHIGMKTDCISGASLILDGTIGLNYYVSFAPGTTEEQKKNAYIIFEGSCSENGKKINLTGSSAACHVAAKNTGDPIKASLYIDGETYDIKSLSVKDYAGIILSKPEIYSKEQELVKALLNYCGSAQKLFGYDAPYVNEGISFTGSTFDHRSSFIPPDPISGLSYYGSSLLLKSETTQRHYFSLTGGKITDYTFTVSGIPAVPVQYDDSNYYYIDRPNINAASLGDAATITVTKGSEKMSFRYSPMDYVSTVLAEDSIQSAELKNTAVALFWYSRAALKYASRA